VADAGPCLQDPASFYRGVGTVRGGTRLPVTPSSPRSRVPIAFAVVGIAALITVVVSIVVVTRSSSSGGSAQALAEKFASSLAGNSATEVDRTLCGGGSVQNDALSLIGSVKAASVRSTSESADSATAMLSITATLVANLPPSSGSTEPNQRNVISTFDGKLTMGKSSGRWCVTSFDARTPTF
ncbi:MAG: hypothetical protein ACR2KJ_15900, partial [Jatrophihabitans sp.]